MIEIDGSTGEGGGQIVRTALSLSALTGKPFKIFNLRAGRTPPGLKNQHLTVARAMEEICSAHIEGAFLGSTDLTFAPSDILAGEYKFDIGTAGSVTLLLQAIPPAALAAKENLEIEVIGGTNVPYAPPIDHFIHVFMEILKSHGARVDIELVRRGYYPKGGGMVRIETWPGTLRPIELTEFELGSVHCISFSSCRPDGAARRQENAAKLAFLSQKIISTTKMEESEADNEGGGVQCIAKDKSSPAIVGGDALWLPSKSDEETGRQAALGLLDELERNPAVDKHTADQLLIYLALSGGRIRTSEITRHTITNIQIIEKFLPVKFDVSGTTIIARRS